MEDYERFIRGKSQLGGEYGFAPLWLPDCLFGFQRHLVEWAIRRGRAALFEACGLGKTLQELCWAENVARHTGRPVLVLTPLAVAPQTVREGRKFGIDAEVSRDGKIPCRVTVTNYERLHYFDPEDFAGVVADESSILKSFTGKRRRQVTEFLRTRPYRLLATATPSPNDYVELGTSSEALGELGHQDMLSRFFKNDQNTNQAQRLYSQESRWRFRGHAETPFWRWVCSWARAVRRPSDLGFDDGDFDLPELVTREHVVKASTRRPGELYDLPAVTMDEILDERRRTVRERCERAAELVCGTGKPAICWCNLNPEGDLLERLIPGCVQVAGADPDEKKEEAFEAFCSGQARVLVTKPKIGGWGLNFQHCARMTFFPTFSYEAYHQCVSRCQRFGQKETVTVDVVASEGEIGVRTALDRKARQAERMFDRLALLMNDPLIVERANPYTRKETAPSWL